MNPHNMGGMGPNYYNGHQWNPWLIAFLPLIILVAVVWSLFWKGLALWHSGRRGQYWWFVILLVVNTLGILEIIYLFAVARLHWRELFSTIVHHDHHVN